MSVIDNLAGLSNLELLKDELLLKKSKSVFDDIFPGLHGDNFGVNGLDLEDLEEQIDVEDLIKTADQIEFFPPQPHRVCVQENAIEKDEISRITDKITQGKQGYRCLKCDRTFSYKANLKKHTESQVHERKKMEYKCDKCTEIFTRKEKLEKHNAFIHEGNKPAYKCHLCDSRFSFKSLLARHEIQVHDKKIRMLAPRKQRWLTKIKETKKPESETL